MRAAPAVQVTLAPDRGWRIFSRALGAAALGGLAASAAMRLGWPQAGVIAATALAALLGAWAGRRLVGPHEGMLSWDGAAWHWQAAGQPEPQPAGEVRVAIDLGPWMLLRAHPAGRPALWLPLAERRAGAGWHPLRAAVARPGRGAE